MALTEFVTALRYFEASIDEEDMTRVQLLAMYADQFARGRFRVPLFEDSRTLSRSLWRKEVLETTDSLPSVSERVREVLLMTLSMSRDGQEMTQHRFDQLMDERAHRQKELDEKLERLFPEWAKK